MRIRLSELRDLVREALAGGLGGAVIIAGVYRGKSAGPRGYTRYKPFKYSSSGNAHPIVYAKTFPTAEEAAEEAPRAQAQMRTILNKSNRSGYLKSYSVVAWDFDADAPIQWGPGLSGRSSYLYDSTSASNKLFQQWGIKPAGAAPSPAPAPAAAAATAPAPASGPPPSEQTYRIYGRRGTAPASTRVKGKVYLAPRDTRFRAGQQASVSRLGDKLQVRDATSDDKQTWDPE